MKSLRPTDLNPSGNEKFNSDTAELLGFTREYLNANAGLELPSTVILLAHEIALTSSHLNSLCAKFDKLLTIERISDIQRKQVEWAEMVASRRAIRVAREREKIVKSLRGVDKRIYAKTGELPSEYEDRIKKAFDAFIKLARAGE